MELINKLYLPSEYFEVYEDATTKSFNGKEYVQIHDLEGLSEYSFQTNRVRFDYEWYEDFVLELKGGTIITGAKYD